MKHIGPIEHPIEIENKNIVMFKFDYFEIDENRYATCYLGEFKEEENLMIRIESACIFGHVFRCCALWLQISTYTGII